MHCVATRIAYGRRKCARLKNEYLRNIIGSRRCEAILHALLESGDLQRVSGYIVGRQSFGYYPAEHFIPHNLRKFVPTEPCLRERILTARERARTRQEEYRRPIHTFWERNQKLLT